MSENPFKNLEEEEIDMTVTLCLDDGSEVECEVACHLPGQATSRCTWRCFPSSRKVRTRTTFIYTGIPRMPMAIRCWTTSRTMRNTDIVADAFDELMDSGDRPRAVRRRGRRIKQKQHEEQTGRRSRISVPFPVLSLKYPSRYSKPYSV